MWIDAARVPSGVTTLRLRRITARMIVRSIWSARGTVMHFAKGVNPASPSQERINHILQGRREGIMTLNSAVSPIPTTRPVHLRGPHGRQFVGFFFSSIILLAAA